MSILNKITCKGVINELICVTYRSNCITYFLIEIRHTPRELIELNHYYI